MLNTFQAKVLKFERLTRTMSLPESKRDVNKLNIIWLYKNLSERNSKHKDYKEAMEMITEWYNQIYSKGKLS